MIYTTNYLSPIGNLLIASKNGKLIGLWIEGQKYYLSTITEKMVEKDNEDILVKTKHWLDEYFCGKNPSISLLEMEPFGSAFQKDVWNLLLEIPYGSVVTYQDIAIKIAHQKNLKSMSCQAVGSAIGHNPISIIIPCHRVIGKNGKLTGYAGGIAKKEYLLQHENALLSFCN